MPDADRRMVENLIVRAGRRIDVRRTVVRAGGYALQIQNA